MRQYSGMEYNLAGFPSPLDRTLRFESDDRGAAVAAGSEDEETEDDERPEEEEKPRQERVLLLLEGEGIPPEQGGPDPRAELKSETENGAHESSHAILPVPPFP